MPAVSTNSRKSFDPNQLTAIFPTLQYDPESTSAASAHSRIRLVMTGALCNDGWQAQRDFRGKSSERRLTALGEANAVAASKIWRRQDMWARSTVQREPKVRYAVQARV
jgi:hypothetical protein